MSAESSQLRDEKNRFILNIFHGFCASALLRFQHFHSSNPILPNSSHIRPNPQVWCQQDTYKICETPFFNINFDNSGESRLEWTDKERIDELSADIAMTRISEGILEGSPISSQFTISLIDTDIGDYLSNRSVDGRINLGAVYSWKEYEDILYSVRQNTKLLSTYSQQTNLLMDYIHLFDTSCSDFGSKVEIMRHIPLSNLLQRRTIQKECGRAFRSFNTSLLEDCYKTATNYVLHNMTGYEKLLAWIAYGDRTDTLSNRSSMRETIEYRGKHYRVIHSSSNEFEGYLNASQVSMSTSTSQTNIPDLDKDSNDSSEIDPLADFLDSNGHSSIVLESDPIPKDLLAEGKILLLNIGGIERLSGWININSQMKPYGRDGLVDIIRNMDRLEGVPNNSVSAIYSSHTLEHNSIGDGALFGTLNEWRRVLAPGGLLLLSVPDLETIFRMYLDDSLEPIHKVMAMHMIYGGQVDEFDYHKIGFNEEILTAILLQHGYCEVERVASFNLFEDTSTMNYQGYFISLNMAAKKCVTQMDIELGLHIDISHNAEPFDRRNQ